MTAFMRWYAGETREALAEAEKALELAAAVAYRRAEMVAHHAAFFCRHALMDLEKAQLHADRALALSTQLGARRFDSLALALRAEALRLLGRAAEAHRDAEEAVWISRDTGPTFLPLALGALARASGNRNERFAALQEAESILRAGAVSHNHLLFGRDAIDAYLELEDWEGVERAVSAMERATRAEPMAFSNFYIARGRALARHGQGIERPAAIAAELARVRAEGERIGLLVALPALDRALSDQRQ